MTKKFIVLDTETAPLPGCVGCDPSNMLVYDIGWIVTDNTGTVYERRSFIVHETFRDEDLMTSAYYADKIPIYNAGLVAGTWRENTFLSIYRRFSEDCRKYGVKKVWAYNARFDRDVLNTTIAHYSQAFRKVFLPYGCSFYDIMTYAKTTIVSMKKYTRWCNTTGNLNRYNKPSNSAQSVYRFLKKDGAFIEAHTALADCNIELHILQQCKRRKGKQPKPLGVMAYQPED